MPRLTRRRPAVRAAGVRARDRRTRALRWIAAAVAVCCLLLTIECWRRMGDDWRMDIGARKTALITDGLFRAIRHPIYAFSMLLMVCSALIVPTLPMIADRRSCT